MRLFVDETWKRLTLDTSLSMKMVGSRTTPIFLALFDTEMALSQALMTGMLGGGFDGVRTKLPQFYPY